MAHSPYDVTLDSTVVRQIRSLTHNTGSSVINAFGSGEPSPAAVFQGDSPHSSNMQSTDLATLLALNTSTFISSGVCIDGANVDVPFRKRANCGTYATGGSHSAIRCAGTTLITPDSISGSQGESATIDCTLRYQSSDGVTSPVSVLSGETLATATFLGEYLLAKVVVDGTAVPELQSVSVSPGITVDEQKSGGGPFATAFFETEKIPTVDITTEDVATTLALINAATLGSGVVLYFQKRAPGGIVEAAGNTSHISITAAAGLRQATTVGGDSRSNSTGTIRINPLALTAAVGVAIP